MSKTLPLGIKIAAVRASAPLIVGPAEKEFANGS